MGYSPQQGEKELDHDRPIRHSRMHPHFVEVGLEEVKWLAQRQWAGTEAGLNTSLASSASQLRAPLGGALGLFCGCGCADQFLSIIQLHWAG